MSLCNKLQIQISGPIFDDLTQNFVISSIIWFNLSYYKMWKSIWVQVFDSINHRAYVLPSSFIYKSLNSAFKIILSHKKSRWIMTMYKGQVRCSLQVS
jgi:hypothetical protein